MKEVHIREVEGLGKRNTTEGIGERAKSCGILFLNIIAITRTPVYSLLSVSQLE